MAKKWKKRTGPKVDHAENMAIAIRDMLKNSKNIWDRPWKLLFNGYYCVDGNRFYEGIINNMILVAWCYQHGFTSMATGTKNQWDNLFIAAGIEEGCRIVKDSKAAHIFRPQPQTKYGADKKPLLDANGNKQTYMAYRTYPVFNADQIVDADKVLVAPVAPVNVVTDNDAIDTYIARTGIETYHGGNRAFYSSSGDGVTMPPKVQFETTEGYYTTWLHEIVHATGHKSRCNRPMGNPKGSKEYAKEELNAEIGSFWLYGLFGLECRQPDQHASYLTSWLKALDDDPKYIFDACKHAQRAIKWLDECQPVPLKVAA